MAEALTAAALPVAALLAVPPAPVAAAAGANEPPPPPDASSDEEAPEWPDEAVESAMRAEQRDRDGEPSAAPRARVEKAPATEDDAALPLPKLDALIAQIPADVRETIEELFRARFTSVQRVPKAALK